MYIHGEEHDVKVRAGGGGNKHNMASPFCIRQFVVSVMIFGARAAVTVNISVVRGVAPIVRCADGSGIAGLSETSIQVFVPDYRASHQVFVYSVQCGCKSMHFERG